MVPGADTSLMTVREDLSDYDGHDGLSLVYRASCGGNEISYVDPFPYNVSQFRLSSKAKSALVLDARAEPSIVKSRRRA
eukprot:2588958-Amphidinium_carterae.1